MIKLIQNLDHSIFKESEGPFISIYLNTHAVTSDVEQDIILFKNHLKTVEESLKKMVGNTQVKLYMEPLKTLYENKTFWHHNQLALAIFSSKNDTVVMRLTQAVKEIAVVSDSLYINPLYRYMQNRGSYDCLALDKEHFELYTCTKEVCKRVPFPTDIQTSKEAIIGKLDEEGYLSHASYDGASTQAMYHGHEDSRAIEEKDLERFFGYIDQVIYKTYSEPTKRPLILWALAEQAGQFRKLSKNKYLIDEGVNHSTKDLSEALVLEKTWPVMETRYQNEIKKTIEKYHNAISKGLASENIHEIGKKIIENNIELAMIQADKTMPGKLNEVDGTVIESKPNVTNTNDILDDMAKRILAQGGKVLVLEESMMPSDKPISAIFRY